MLDEVRGSIAKPVPGDQVGRTVECSGTLTGMGENVTAWLVIEVGENIWPKEGRLSPNANGLWTHAIFEDGTADEGLAISLFATNPEADARIESWLEAGREADDYPPLDNRAGMRRVARVDGLSRLEAVEVPTDNADPRRLDSGRSNLFLLLLLIGLVLGFAITIATGALQFGLEAPVVYVLYVFAGLATAKLCYGWLDSKGELDGQRHGFTLKLSGAIVGLVVVTGGGGLYERYLRTPSSFDVRLTFEMEDESVPDSLEGDDIILHFGNDRRVVPIDKHGSALVQGIASHLKQKMADVQLSSERFRIAGGFKEITLDDTEAIIVRVVTLPPFVDESAADLDLKVIDARSTAMAEAFAFPRSMSFTLQVVNRSNKSAPIDSTGYMRIQTKEGVSMHEIELKVFTDMRGEGAFLQPSMPTTVFVEAPMYAGVQASLDRDYEAIIQLVYDTTYGKSGRRFSVPAFDFARQNLGFDEDLLDLTASEAIIPDKVESGEIESNSP